MKLCVLSDETADEVAPLIAKFANSQNVVKRTDLTSNHPVYRELEKLSRSTLAPAQDGAQVETKWYFERARGQYLDELFKEGSPANKKKFENRFPRNQKFDKGHLAKCWGIWHQQVQDVSLGNEKYHVEFIDDLDKNINKFDMKRPEASYRRLISLIIIRNHVYKKIRGEKLGYSFPGNVTDYTIALISQLCSMQFDLETVWKFQRPQAEFMANVERLAPVVANTIKELCEQHGVIANELAKGRRVAGGKTLWTILKEMSLSLEPELPTAGDGPIDPGEGTGAGVPTPDVSKEIQAVVAAGEQRLWDVVMWSKDTGNLQPWQRQITASVAKLLQKAESLLKNRLFKLFELWAKLTSLVSNQLMKLRLGTAKRERKSLNLPTGFVTVDIELD